MFKAEELQEFIEFEQQQAELKLIVNDSDFKEEDEEESVTFLNDVNVFPRSPDRRGSMPTKEADVAEQEFLVKGAELEMRAFGRLCAETKDLDD